MTAPTALSATPPLHPGAGQARNWLLQELSKPAYNDSGPSFIERLGATIKDFLHQVVTGVSLPIGPAGAIILGLIVAAIVALAVWWAGRPSSPRRSGSAVFEPGVTPASAASYRRSAEDAAGRKDWKTAVIERFRALARAMEERTIIDPQPGFTAHEVGAQSAAVLPDLAGDLQRAATIFDGVYYGDRPATHNDYAAIGMTDDAAASAQPAFASTP